MSSTTKFDSEGFDLSASNNSNAIYEIGGGITANDQSSPAAASPPLEPTAESERLKELGNDHFRQGNHLDAFDYYTDAIEAAPYGEGIGPRGDELLRLQRSSTRPSGREISSGIDWRRGEAAEMMTVMTKTRRTTAITIKMTAMKQHKKKSLTRHDTSTDTNWPSTTPTVQQPPHEPSRRSHRRLHHLFTLANPTHTKALPSTQYGP
ncbi:hypothetical protein ACHAWO_009633 [Cyclotella atomus]|uniref:Uncharacterized protein n=1 Tax=Cyclotella atomus TaxID=382360 RepID=A0ABD3MZ35_9STRA